MSEQMNTALETAEKYNASGGAFMCYLAGAIVDRDPELEKRIMAQQSRYANTMAETGTLCTHEVNRASQ